MTTSKIEWTEKTWNPTVGCTKVSPGCKHCYAEAMAGRLKAMGTPGYEHGFELTLLPQRLDAPLRRRTPTVYFVNSMSDLFHESIPFDYIQRVIDVIARAHWHTFQILTKRAERMATFFRDRCVPLNAWLGVTVEDRLYGIPRMDALREIDAKIRFLSMEPLLEDMGMLDLNGIHWVIVGGESGPKARPMEQDWVDSIRRQCEDASVAMFFKQWGGWGADGVKRAKKQNGRELHGRTWDQMPNLQTHA
ncbi:MAG: phage Gp37/Gp68 family protein [Chromatiaceae bacterium]|nr:phage Gp37/Gp68 family protein [Chromatiaceae bacterium]MCF7993730.1 phage Gp37/Gp68 family protein [Chromatiaceae bacterium]MCF8016784.1 phage Gp37/Gp68 family protein [Chromatiaceae bacterium]